MTRIAREDHDPDFACDEAGKAAMGRGFLGLVRIPRVGLGSFTGCEFVMALPGHFHLAWRSHPTLVRALGLHAFELPCSGDCLPGALECRLSLCRCYVAFKRAAFTFSIGVLINIVAPLSTAAVHQVEYAPVGIGASVLKILTDAHAHYTAVLDRLQLIADLNHHIRNALQVIACLNVSAPGRSEEAIEQVREAVARIDSVLKDMLPPTP